MDFLGEADRRAVEISIRCPVERLRDTRSCLGVQGGVSRGVRSVGVAEPGVADPDAGSVRGDLASGETDPCVSETFGRGVGFGRCILSNFWARGLIGSLGVPSPERGVVDVGWLLTGILVIGGSLVWLTTWAACIEPSDSLCRTAQRCNNSAGLAALGLTWLT